MTSLLNADALRRLAGPLRSVAPGFYVALNRVRGRLIARGGGLPPYQSIALREFRKTCLSAGPAGKDVPELGTDLRLQALDQIAAMGVRSATGVNNSEAFWQSRPEGEVHGANGARLLRGDACALGFDDASFDAVFSVALFEHILELPKALREVHRVLRPGGRCYAAFGPIWSGCRGHHVNAAADGQEIRHADPRKNVLPDFCHLLLSPEEMRAAIAARFTPALGEAVVESVYRTSYLNRLFFSEYERAIRESPLRVIRWHPIRDTVAPALDRILRLKYPNEARFDVTLVEVVLEKAPACRRASA